MACDHDDDDDDDESLDGRRSLSLRLSVAMAVGRSTQPMVPPLSRVYVQEDNVEASVAKGSLIFIVAEKEKDVDSDSNDTGVSLRLCKGDDGDDDNGGGCLKVTHCTICCAMISVSVTMCRRNNRWTMVG